MRKCTKLVVSTLLCLGIAGNADAWRRDSRPSASPESTRVLRDVSYGADPRQRFDVYLPAKPRQAPVILMAHGGGWRFGDKDSPGVVGAKADYWVSRGYVLVSVNYRMQPQAAPLQQARDVAHALAAAQRAASGWGADRERVVLMGHSAGAHLVALLAAAPELLREAGATPPRGAVLIDSGAYDVEQLMRRRHPPLYDRAFGADPEAWATASPYARLSRQSLPMFAVCSTRRPDDACAGARRFAERAKGFGTRVEVLPQPLTHMAINRELGEPSAYTEAVAAFLRSIGV